LANPTLYLTSSWLKKGKAYKRCHPVASPNQGSKKTKEFRSFVNFNLILPIVDQSIWLFRNKPMKA
jgi:hypothetical protein